MAEGPGPSTTHGVVTRLGTPRVLVARDPRTQPHPPVGGHQPYNNCRSTACHVRTQPTHQQAGTCPRNHWAPAPPTTRPASALKHFEPLSQPQWIWPHSPASQHKLQDNPDPTGSCVRTWPHLPAVQHQLWDHSQRPQIPVLHTSRLALTPGPGFTYWTYWWAGTSSRISWAPLPPTSHWSQVHHSPQPSL